MDAASYDERAAVRRLALWLSEAQRVCVLTGAGMSAESGVPTFRDAQGLWSNFNPAELATPEAFRRDPRKVWDWYRWRRNELRRVEPHVGHRLLAEWEARVRDFVVVTQNVDGLHHRAGSKRVIELHGRLDVTRCTDCEHHVLGLDDLGEDPRCPSCGGRLRPGVVWFGELLPEGAMEAASQAAAESDVLLVIGTSGMVYPAASLVEMGRAYGARVVEVNPNPTELSWLAHLCLRASCGSALQAVDEEWRRLAW